MVPIFFRVAFKRILLLLLAYMVCRLSFLLWNADMFRATPTEDILLAFVHGLRFDLSAILITNAPLLLLWLAPAQIWEHRWVQRLEISLFALVNLVALGLSIMDVEYVNFIGKRTSMELLMIREDVQRHSLSIAWTYKNLIAGLLVLTGVVVSLAPRFEREEVQISLVRGLVFRGLAVALAVVGIRGGFQFKPLHPMHAYFTTRHEVGLLTLNSPFNFVKSKPRRKIEKTLYFSDNREAITIAKTRTEPSRPPLGVAPNWNVVIILLESWATEYTGIANPGMPGYTPFFDELAAGAYYFKHGFANARRSIEGLPAVLCSLPAIMDEPIITSDFANNRFDCLPKILGRKGYSTYFLHGAHNGSMHFDTFSKIAGFEHFVGLNEYPKDNPADLDGYWGVLDEPMLQYATKLIDQAPKPVMMGVFTLSSHHPYFIPPQHRGKFPKGTLEIHESVGYTDYALRKFFETASTKPWYNNTIFVITSDHTQKLENPRYKDTLGYYRVPLAIYVPGLKEKLPVASERIVQHIDIVPSVLDLLGFSEPDRLLTGLSVFDQGRSGRAYNWTARGYWYLNDQYMVDFGREGAETLAFTHSGTYNLKPYDPAAKDVQPVISELKAFVHYLNDGLFRNKLHAWREQL